jgi:hypothetical protein
MNTHAPSFLVAITLTLAVGCGTARGAVAAGAPAGASHTGEGGEADGHTHEHDPAADDERSAPEPPDGAESARDACAAIAELCHDVDGSSADAHQCHVLGHSRGDGAGCDEHLEHCRAACGAGTGTHAGH